MATIHKLTKDGSTIFPATITDAIVHPNTGKTLTSMIKDYNVSELFPSEGLDGGNKYNLALAIQVLGSHLTAAEKTGGIKVTFISSVSPYPEEEYYLNKNTWSTTLSDWGQRFEVGDVIANPSGSWEQGTAEQYIDQQTAILTTNLASETITRQTVDSNLQTQINTEVSTRTASDNTQNGRIGVLEEAYRNLTESDVIVGPRPSSGQQANVIYREPDQGHTPPQFYCDYMWYDNAWVLMAQYDNGIDNNPLPNSNNLVKSSGVFNSMGAYDISANNSGHIYQNLTEALNAVPSAMRAGGISVKFIQEITPAKYRLVKTEGLTTEPTGTELSSNPNLVSGTYTAAQLNNLSTVSALPTTLNSSKTYYLEVAGDSTTYTTWVVTYVSTSDNKYIQARCMAQSFTTDVTQWQGVDDEPTAGSDNLVKSDGTSFYVSKKCILERSVKFLGNLLPFYIYRFENKTIINSGGRIVFADLNTFITYVFPLEKQSDYRLRFGRLLALLDSDGETIIGDLQENKTSFTSGNASYVAFSFQPSDYPEDEYYFCKGDTQTLESSVSINGLTYNLNSSNIEDILNTTNSDKINLLNGAKRKQNCYYNTSYSSNNNYDTFEINVTSGTTYYISPFRFLSKAGTNIQGETTERYTYTADFTGVLYVSFDKRVAGWVVSTLDSVNIRPFNTPSFCQPYLGQDFGKKKDVPYSQYGILEYLKRIVNKYNLTFFSLLKEGYYHNGAYNAGGSYDVYEIPVTNGTSYTISKGIRFLSKQGSIIGNYSDGTTEDTTYVSTFTGILYVTYFKTANNRYVCETSSLTAVGMMNKNMLAQSVGDNENIPISQKGVKDEIIKNRGNSLYGKKWVACGDSFTHGDFTGSSEQYTFTDEPYQGENKVYPFIIGRRNNMTIVNEAINGSTMTDIGGLGQRSPFSLDRYKNIPSDADYITLYFGINDHNYNAPIGTINDNTNETFYGAWNIVMNYLIENHPDAKIGIIITNGSMSSSDLQTPYTEAEINIAKKFGVAYLNLANDSSIPYFFRQWERTDVDDSIKLLRHNYFKVGNGNNHPNVKAHEFESSIIENFLRSL